MSHNRWQFPTRMAPVLSIPRVENIKLDQWEPRVNQPVRRKTLTTAILAGALFFVPVVSVATTPSIAAWGPQVSQPVRVKARPLHAGFVVDPSALNRPIRTLDPLSDPVRVTPQNNTGSISIDPAALNRPIRYFAPLEEPVRTTPQNNPGSISIDPKALSRPIRLFDPLAEPGRVTPPNNSGFTSIDPIALNLPEPAQIDKWGQPTEQPPRRSERIVESGLTEFSPLPIPSVAVPPFDSWEPRLVMPPRGRAPVLAEGSFVIDPIALDLPEPPQIDKWGQSLSQPQQRIIRVTPSDQFQPLVIPVAVPDLDSWEPRTYGPVPARRPLVAHGWTVVDPAAMTLPERAQLDKWYQPLAAPVRTVPPVQAGLFVIDPAALNLPEPVQLDKWEPKISQHVRRPALPVALQAGVLFFVPVVSEEEESQVTGAIYFSGVSIEYQFSALAGMTAKYGGGSQLFTRLSGTPETADRFGGTADMDARLSGTPDIIP